MIKSVLGKFGLYFAWIVSIVATGGSLYLSLGLGYPPCDLCWYQRIFMYPLVMMLGIATYRQDQKIQIYVYPLVAVGGLLSIYHYLVQKVPYFANAQQCSSAISCVGDPLYTWTKGTLLEFLTVPLLALIAFLFIFLFLLFSNKDSQQAVDEK